MSIKGKSSTLLVITAGITVCILLVAPVYQIRDRYAKETITQPPLPPELVNFLSLEFKGVTANLLFLQTISFVGGRLKNKERLTKEEWQQVYKMLCL